MPRTPATGAVVVLAALLTACTLPFSHDEGRSRPPSGTASTTTAGTPRVGDAPVTVTVRGVGDVLVHRPVSASAQQYARRAGRDGYDFNPMFDGPRALLSSADVALCHQETPISATNRDLSVPDSLVYNVPREVAPALRAAGFDGCDIASNHALDQGVGGIGTTRARLRAAGLQVAGQTTSAQDPGMPAIHRVKGVRIAHLAYSYSVANQGSPTTVPPRQTPFLGRWLWPRRGVAGILGDARSAKQAGADLVVVSMHWGQEYRPAPTAEQVSYAKALLASPYVDGILGAHAHLVQPCVTVGGKTAFYGMGNFLSNQGPGTAGGLGEVNADGVIAGLTFTRDAQGRWTQRASFTPTVVRLRQGHRIVLATPRSDPASYARTTAMLQRPGCTAVPEVPAG